jgi:hypothetical protein
LPDSTGMDYHNLVTLHHKGRHWAAWLSRLAPFFGRSSFMVRWFHGLAHAAAGVLLLSASTRACAQGGAPLPPNAAALGRGISTTPGYGGMNPYVNPTPTVVPSSAPAYTSAAPYAGPSTAVPYYPSYPYYQPPFGATLQGYASLTQATGQYWKDIGSARITREQANQATLDTKRKQIEFEMWYEKIRPTAPKMRAAEQAADLDWARRDPPNSEIWSGRTLNVLLKSILNSSQPTSGPQLALEENIVSGLNLTDKTSRGNLALAKDEGKIAWPEALQEEAFDEARDRFSKNFNKALVDVKDGDQPPISTLRDLRKDLKTLEDTLDDKVRDLAPSRYIESRRLLNQLKNTVKGLSDPRLCKSCNNNWRKNVKSVSDLVGYCMKNGLEFGPATAPGDYPSYTAAYYAIRNYERGLWTLSSAR